MTVYRGAAKLFILIEFSNPILCPNFLALERHTQHTLPRSSLERFTAPRVHKLVEVYLRNKFLDFGFSSFSLASVTFQNGS